MRKQRCETCDFWVRLPPDFQPGLVAALKTIFKEEELNKVEQHGQCRANPPIVTERSVATPRKPTVNLIFTEFPDMPETGWCGFWKEKQS